MKFKKGKSGNPKGRPKRPSFRDALEKDHMEYLALFWISVKHNLEKKDPKFTQWFGEQFYGRPVQTISDESGESLGIITVIPRPVGVVGEVLAN